MRFHFRTLQQRLFTYYSTFFFIFLLIIVTLFYLFYSDYMQSNVEEQQRQLGTSLITALDQKVEELNSFSMSIVYSNLVREHFNHPTARTTSAESHLFTDPKDYQETTTLIDAILAYISSSRPGQQANIYDFDGRMVGAGIFNGQQLIDLPSMPWYEETVIKDGFKYISMIDDSSLPVLQRQNNGKKKYLSLTRIYKNGNYVSQGIIQITQDCDVIFAFLQELKEKSPYLQIYVLDSEGNMLFPYNDERSKQDGQSYRNRIRNEEMLPDNTYQVENMRDGSKEMLTYFVSEKTGWTIIITQSQKELFAYLHRFTNIFVWLSLITLLLILLTSYVVSKRVTLPLQNLQTAVRKMDVTNFSNNDFLSNQHERSIDEIEALNHAFHSLNQKLSQSIEEVLAARSQELDAKFFALQSQMSPHFLYNNLTNISVMAEEGMNEQIVKLCENMSYMLRYLAAQPKQGVPLEAEIEYTKRFLECMKIRYEDHLHYSIKIPPSMKQMLVPMLLVQPLVENCMKHGLTTSPPWRISITGEMYGDNIWRITVSDNGPGFDTSVIRQLEEFMQTPLDIRHIPDLEINGMGMKNIYIRLRLMYRESAYMMIQNHADRGVSVTIGGTLPMEDKGKSHDENKRAI